MVSNYRALASKWPIRMTGTRNVERQKKTVDESDVPLRILQSFAAALEFPLRKFVSRRQNLNHQVGPALPITVGFALVLMYPAVAIVDAFYGETLLIDSVRVKTPLVTDYPQLFLMTASPIAIVLGVSFYRRLFPLFERLKSEKVILERSNSDFEKAIGKINRRLNSWWPQLLFIPLSIIGTILAYRANHIASESGERWVSEVSLGPDVWLTGMTFLGWWMTLLFAYKCIVVILGINALLDQRKFEWSTPSQPSDGADAVFDISTTWFRVHLIAVLIGCFIVLHAAATNRWTEPQVVFGISAYIVLAPLIFFGPLLSVHRAMVEYKERVVLDTRSRLNSARKIMEDDIRNGNVSKLQQQILVEEYMGRNFARVSNLPTWPMNIAMTKIVSVTYILPLPVGFLANWLFEISRAGGNP